MYCGILFSMNVLLTHVFAKWTMILKISRNSYSFNKKDFKFYTSTYKQLQSVA